MIRQYTRVKINIPGILATAFLLVFFFAKLIDMPAIISNGMIAFTGITCFAYSLFKQKVSQQTLFWGILLSVMMICSTSYNGNSSYFEVLWLWCFWGVACIFAYFPISSKVITRVFIIVSIVFSVLIVLNTSPQDALASASGNNISVIVLFYVMLIYIKRYEEKKNVIYWPCIAAVVFSIWGNGRAGILASAIMLILVFFYGTFSVKRKKFGALLRVGVLLVIAAFLMQRYFGSYIETLTYKMDRYGNTSIRTEIWKEYITAALGSVKSFLLGPPTVTGSTPLLSSFDGNAHNAFLVLHSKYGIIGFLYVLFSVISYSFRFLNNKRYMYIIIILVWGFRSMFDWTGFPGVFDVIFFYFVIKNMELKKRTANFKKG